MGEGILGHQGSSGRGFLSNEKELIHSLLERFIQNHPHEYAKELQGISRVLNMNVGDVTLLNMYFDTFFFGTHIMVEDTEGRIFHGRNLDVNSKTSIRDLTIDVEFVKKGKIAYTGTTFVGYVGLWTGQSPYKFTISGNARGHMNWLDYLTSFLAKGFPDSWLIRDTLSEANHFINAYVKLTKTPLLNNAYFMLAGTRDGVVITRDKFKTIFVSYLDPFKKPWYLVQTQCDSYSKSCRTYPRRAATTKALIAIKKGQKKLSTSNMHKILTSFPVFNESTVYTTIMTAEYPHLYQTWIKSKDHHDSESDVVHGEE
ncbi:N-acylethanolamine-hydrolyzing acid amidase-like [Hyla sarda]|uniref:N-acylethanolamine-hydrolyzing acid amidase-like n=1 Tax=Hyla sarda TaxID=327740 RepID=UPI0024C2EE19|nr:N-acylethanolamine-hydrolyzing acid amidase-like [Hyla sarda]